jgi:hypothetical protein
MTIVPGAAVVKTLAAETLVAVMTAAAVMMAAAVILAEVATSGVATPAAVAIFESLFSQRNQRGSWAIGRQTCLPS